MLHPGPLEVRNKKNAWNINLFVLKHDWAAKTPTVIHLKKVTTSADKVSFLRSTRKTVPRGKSMSFLAPSGS